jgi:ATP-binding cassette, subfamily C (CFTR/MRP), member 1
LTSISIDGIPLSVLPRQTIRSRLIGVPQDAYLLPGPVRLNAEPLKQCTDKEITLALKAVQLWEIVVKNSSPMHHSHPLDVSSFRRSTVGSLCFYAP